MRATGAATLVIIGFLLLYLSITGKMDCFFTFISCLFGTAPAQTATSNTSANTTSGSGVTALVQAATQPFTKTVPTFIDFRS